MASKIHSWPSQPLTGSHFVAKNQKLASSSKFSNFSTCSAETDTVSSAGAASVPPIPMTCHLPWISIWVPLRLHSRPSQRFSQASAWECYFLDDAACALTNGSLAPATGCGLLPASIPAASGTKVSFSPDNPSLVYTRALFARVTLGITTSSLPSLNVALAFEGSTSQGKSMTWNISCACLCEWGCFSDSWF